MRPEHAEKLTPTLTSELRGSIDRVWTMWSDPRKLERWWGPPTYPATFVEHALTPGARVTYFMTGPSGDQHHGWWRILAAVGPSSLEFEDGFADAAGQPNLQMPTTKVHVSLVESAGTTTMTIVSSFSSIAQMEKLVAMGMVEGLERSSSKRPPVRMNLPRVRHPAPGTSITKAFLGVNVRLARSVARASAR